MTIKIWHNPRCSKSRETLALLQEKGISPEIVLYLEQKHSTESLQSVIDKLGITPRELLRSSESAYKDNDLKDKTLTNDALIQAMITEPKLIQRPIVINGGKARLGRPPEQVLEIL